MGGAGKDMKQKETNPEHMSRPKFDCVNMKFSQDLVQELEYNKVRLQN